MRSALSALMTALLLLTGCAGGPGVEGKLERQRDALRSCPEIRFQAEVTGAAGDRVFTCTLDCVSTPEETVLTVASPESIAGIAAVTDGETGSLVCDGLCLGLGTLPGTELAPAAAPGRLVRAWARDWIASAGTEDGALLACYEDGSLTARTWFDAEGVPLRAELSIDGRTRFTAEIRNFQWNPSP